MEFGSDRDEQLSIKSIKNFRISSSRLRQFHVTCYIFIWNITHIGTQSTLILLDKLR